MSELRVQFHRQLTELEGHVIELFALVSEDLLAATDSLLSEEGDAMKLITEREMMIDSVYADAEEMVTNHLSLQAPVAAELRLLVSVLRIVPELERSHDLVVHIAESATHHLGLALTPRCRGLVQQMGDLAADMWRRSADAWYRRDGTAAEAIDELDDGLDALHVALSAELASGQMTIAVVMEMTLVARYYERLGDHAVNIARRVAYLAGTAS